jgi:alkanesulfonate monooxygenase SsuD/methylene tetrahydromethanopterin reductase-like flavin-dependent oxidoreductase (luciferase family)
MSADIEWVLLSYRLPREPSTPRISVWRKLKRLGVAQLGDGLVALPHDARTREQFDWIAAEVEEAGGTATVWLGRPATVRANQDLADQLRQARAAEYRQLVSQALQALRDGEDRAAARRRLQAELHRIGRRDYFPSAERALAAEAVAAIVDNEDVTVRGDER